MRRAVMILAVWCSVVTLSAQSAPGTKGRAADPANDAAVEKVFTSLGEAISGGNFKAAAGLWDDDGVYYSVEGQKVTGPAQIAGAMADALSGVRLTIKSAGVHWASPDVAVAQGSWQAASSDGGGNSGLFMAVLRKAGTGWKLVEVRPWVPGQ